MYSAFIITIVYTFIGGKAVFSAYSGIIYDIKMTLFHMDINIGNNLFPPWEHKICYNLLISNRTEISF